MNNEIFNLELRQFLKRFGVSAQRAIELAVQSGMEEGKLSGREVLPVSATLTIPGLVDDFVIDGNIALDDASTT